MELSAFNHIFDGMQRDDEGFALSNHDEPMVSGSPLGWHGRWEAQDSWTDGSWTDAEDCDTEDSGTDTKARPSPARPAKGGRESEIDGLEDMELGGTSLLFPPPSPPPGSAPPLWCFVESTSSGTNDEGHEETLGYADLGGYAFEHLNHALAPAHGPQAAHTSPCPHAPEEPVHQPDAPPTDAKHPRRSARPHVTLEAATGHRAPSVRRAKATKRLCSVPDRAVNRPPHNHTAQDKRLVRAWLAANVANPYPDAETKAYLSQRSSLTLAQLSNFLINERKRSPLFKYRSRCPPHKPSPPQSS